MVTTGLFDEDIPLSEPSRTQTAQVNRCLRRFGVWGLRDRSFLTLSYGQRRLALVARAFVGPARVLLLDEVFNGLADKAKLQLRRALEARDAGREWVVTTHRPKELPANITHVAKIEGGRIVAAGPVAAMGHLLHAPVSSGDASVPHGDIAAVGSYSAAPVATTMSSPDMRGAPQPLVVIHNATLYRDYRRVIKGLDWTIESGTHWAVLGAMGQARARCSA